MALARRSLWFLSLLLTVGAAATALAIPQRAPAPRASSSLAGQLLVASPQMDDPTFRGTVIFMLLHDAQGAVGVVVNRPADRAPSAVPGLRLHWGGPVGADALVVLHSDDYALPATQRVHPPFSVTGDPAIVEAIRIGAGPQAHIAAVGYAGWAPGQLEHELSRGAWCVAPASADLVFREDARAMWNEARARATQGCADVARLTASDLARRRAR